MSHCLRPLTALFVCLLVAWVTCIAWVALHCIDHVVVIWNNYCGPVVSAGWKSQKVAFRLKQTNKQTTTIAQQRSRSAGTKTNKQTNKQTRTTITQKRTKRDKAAFKFKVAGLDRSCSALAAPSQLSPSFLLTDVELLGTVYMAVPHIVHLHCLHCLYGRCQLSVSENDQVMSIVSFTDRPATQVQISTDQPKCSVDNRSSAIFYV